MNIGSCNTLIECIVLGKGNIFKAHSSSDGTCAMIVNRMCSFLRLISSFLNTL